MKVLRVTIQEWYPFADVDVDLSRVEVASVIGRIASSPGRSNGAGKSYLLEAIPYALYGYKRDADAVQRLGSTDDTFVEITFEHRGRTARVKRGFKCKDDGTSGSGFLEFDLDGNPQGTGIRVLDAAIVEFMGCDLDLYLSTSFFAQGEADQFASSKPAQRKQILSELLGLDVYNDARLIADAERKALEQSIGSYTQAREIAEMSVIAARRQIDEGDEPALLRRQDVLEEQIRGLSELINDYEVSKNGLDSWVTDIGWAEREHKVAHASFKSTEREAERTLIEVNRAKVDRDERHALRAEEYRKRVSEIRRLPELRSGLAAIYEEITGLTAERDTLPQDDGGLAQWQPEEARALKTIGEAGVRVSNASNGLVDLDAIGPQCPKCKQPLAEAHRASLHAGFTKAYDIAVAERAEAQGRADEAKTVLQDLRVKIARRNHIDGHLPLLRERREEVQGWIDKGEQAATDNDDATESAKAEMATFDDRIVKAEADDERARREHEAAVLALDAALEAHEAARGATDAGATQSLAVLHAALVQRLKDSQHASDENRVALRAVEQARDRKKTHEEKIALLDSQVASVQRSIDIRVWLVEAFGKNGIPSLIYENVVVEIEQGTVEILETLESPFRIRFRTETATGRDTLTIEVETPEGTRGLASFSGGQQTELNLAIRLSLSEVLARRADVSFDSVYLDEVMAPLDDVARQCVLSVVQLMRRSFSQVFVISHHSEIRDVLESCILVEAHPDGSRVEVAA